MKEYFQYLIWLMLFVIVVEMVFPDSSYRKYIKLVLGCILVYTMLKPVIGLVQVEGQDYESYVKRYQSILGDGAEQSAADYQEDLNRQQESMKKIYEESIKTCVEKHFKVQVMDVQVTWQEGILNEIMLTVGRENKVEIGTVHIGEKSSTVDGDEERLKNKIKTCLADFYNVQVGNIYITVQKN